MMPIIDEYPAWLEIHCPECRQELDLDQLECKNGHRFESRDGVPSLLNRKFSNKLGAYLAAFEGYREKEGLRAGSGKLFEPLPYGPMAKGRFEWRLRQQGWENIQARFLPKKGMKILDVGAWNGWLTHRLVTAAQQPVGVDYFSDPLDGLGARKYYPVRWPAIQMDLEELGIIQSRFDLIVFNHCLQFFTSPLGVIEQARKLLLPAGRIVLIGLTFFKDPRQQESHVRAYRHVFRRHGFDSFKQMRGLLDFDDRRQLLEQGINLYPYSSFWRANLRSRVQPGRPRYELGATGPA